MPASEQSAAACLAFSNLSIYLFTIVLEPRMCKKHTDTTRHTDLDFSYLFPRPNQHREEQLGLATMATNLSIRGTRWLNPPTY